MTGTTPNYGFVIPSADGTDLMDAGLWRTPIGQIDTNLKTVDNRLVTAEAINNTDPVQVSAAGSIFTAATGWAVAAEVGYKIGRLAIISATFTRTGATLAAQAEGNITNITLATFKPGWAPLNRTGFNGGGVSGYMWAGYADPASGTNVCAIGAVPPNVPVNTNDGLVATMIWAWK